jgi:biopolymer transport protein ExbD
MIKRRPQMPTSTINITPLIDEHLLFNDVARVIDITAGAGSTRVGLLTSATIFQQPE